MILSNHHMLEGTALFLPAHAPLTGLMCLTRGSQGDSNAPNHLAVLAIVTVSTQLKAA